MPPHPLVTHHWSCWVHNSCDPETYNIQKINDNVTEAYPTPAELSSIISRHYKTFYSLSSTLNRSPSNCVLSKLCIILIRITTEVKLRYNRIYIHFWSLKRSKIWPQWRLSTHAQSLVATRAYCLQDIGDHYWRDSNSRRRTINKVKESSSQGHPRLWIEFSLFQRLLYQLQPSSPA